MLKKNHIYSLSAGLIILFVAGVAFAEGEVAGNGHLSEKVKMYLALSAGFGMAISVLGAALSQGRAVAAAVEGIARNPGAANKIQTPMIIGLALIESLVLFAFLVCGIFLAGKI